MHRHLSHSKPSWHGARAFTARQQPRRLRPRSEGSAGDNGSAKDAFTEDVLARLRKAEAEAAALREQLQTATVASPDEGGRKQPSRGGSRIDGSALRRETLFTSREERGSWLNEADFLARVGPSEAAATEAVTEEEQAVVRRRVLIGVAGTVVLGALSLVDLGSLQPKPSKPLFFYLTPLVRVEALITELDDFIGEGRWADLKQALERIQGAPNNAPQNIRDAIASLQEGSVRQRAQAVGSDLIDQLYSIDSNNYFDAMGTPGKRGGQQEAQFAAFSLQAAHAAQASLRSFLKIMPADELEAARQQAAISAF